MTPDLFRAAATHGTPAGDDGPEVWTVTRVNALARQLLEGSISPLWVAGEVAEFKRLRTGHCFFTLKDARSQISCVMWRDDARALPAEPPEGMAVHAFGRPTVYERRGRFQFVVRQLHARGDGLWRLAFERTRRRLEADGLLDPSRRRPLPPYPRAVGVITSLEGAAVRDVLSVIRRRAPWVDVYLYAARVQGDGAVDSLIHAIRAAARVRRADVLIVGRGGGSKEALWTFNDERVVRQIAESPIPVVSAVGHETDITLADLVADRRAPTPSVAAEVAVPDRGNLSDGLARIGDRMAAALEGSVTRSRDRLTRLERRLSEVMLRGLERRRHRLDALNRRLRAVGPTAVLQRGFAVALDDRGRVLRSVNAFQEGARFRLRLRDGMIRARVVETAAVDADGSSGG